jgi:hypothetical protein
VSADLIYFVRPALTYREKMRGLFSSEKLIYAIADYE